jgi:hypothetical protein
MLRSLWSALIDGMISRISDSAPLIKLRYCSLIRSGPEMTWIVGGGPNPDRISDKDSQKEIVPIIKSI